MQNPDAWSRMAWWSPPPGWKACSTSPRRIASIARIDPRAEPPRRQRVTGAEVIRRRTRTEHEEHAWHDTGVERIYTTPLLDKLGIRPGMRVAILDVDDPDIRPGIGDRTTDLTEGWP